ncbi:hypothetical protein F5051DRAFT_431913 [Lentinula edodes]|nr:hypothetical protein F5051DRAFT_431913 [Lentinula edodes]
MSLISASATVSHCSAQLTWLLGNLPGFCTIQLALSTAPDQNYTLPQLSRVPDAEAPRSQIARSMGQAYFTRLWTNAARSGKLAIPTISLEGEPSGTNSVRVPTVHGYLLSWSCEGGAQNRWDTSYWRLFAKIDLELSVLYGCNSMKISSSHYVLINDKKASPRAFCVFIDGARSYVIPI